MPSVMIVDDLPAVHEMLEAVIKPAGYASECFLNGYDALKRYKDQKFDVVLADISMKPMDGISLLKGIKIYDPHAMVIMITGYSSADSAMQALKFGAFDYVEKPFRIDDLMETLKRAIDSSEKAPPQGKPLVAEKRSEQAISADALIGESEAMKAVQFQLGKHLNSNSPILIQGEVGTGKRSLANIIHEKSANKEGPFIGIDCAKTNENEFSPQFLNNRGEVGPIFNKVKGGTLFLNNIHELSLPMQDLLARALQVSDENYRLICSTVINFDRQWDDSKFSEDFIFKIATLPITLPPLRDRREDIPLLLESILEKAANPYFNVKQIEFSQEAEAIINNYPWPGNITELINVLCAVVATSNGRIIEADQLPRRLKDFRKWPSLDTFLGEQTKIYLKQVLKICNQDEKKAAKVAGVKPAELKKIANDTD